MSVWRRLRPQTPRAQSLVALAAYTAVWVVLIGRDAVADPAHTCACIGSGDPGLFMWALQWWPHAITSGVDPLTTHSIWFPAETNLPATTSVPGISLILWPVTELAGVVVTYNLATLLSAVLSAWFAYRLCRYVTGAWLPSLVGGYVFGFSSYELGQMLGHLHLIPVFLVPAAALLVLLRLDDRIDRRRFVVLLAAIFVLQVLLATEILLAGLFFGFAALLVAAWLVPERRKGIASVVAPIFVAGGLAALVVSPFLYHAFRGLGPQPSLDWPGTARVFSADPLNYVIPTPITWIGGDWTESLAAKFNSSNQGLSGNESESGAYIGLPLLALAGWFVLRTWNRPASRFALVLLALIFVASLGAQLHILEPTMMPSREFDHALWLPWAAFAYLPGFDHLLPVRFSLFAFLVVGVLVAQALAVPLARRAWAPWLVAGIGVAALLPTFSGARWAGEATDTPFFEDGTYKRYLQRDEVVLNFPLQSGDAMVWQASADWYFRMANGYISAEIPPAFWEDPVAHNLLSPTGTGPVAAENLPLALRDFLDRHQVGAVIVQPTYSWWEGVLDKMQLRKDEVGGIPLYRVERQAPYIAWGPELLTVYVSPEHNLRWLERHEADVPIVNPLRSQRTVTLRGVLVGNEKGPATEATIEYPDGKTQELRVGGDGTTVERRLTLAPGASTLRVVAPGPKFTFRTDPRAHHLELRDFEIVP